MKFAVSLVSLCLAAGAGWFCGYVTLRPEVQPPVIPAGPGSSERASVASPTPAVEASPEAEKSLFADLTALLQRKSIQTYELHSFLFERLEKLSPQEIGVLVQQMAESRDNRLSQRSRYVVEYWIDRDVQSARAWIKNAPAARAPSDAYAICNHWAENDPEEFLTWMESLPAEGKLSLLSSAVFASTDLLADKYAERLIAPILKLPFSADQSLNRLFSMWARNARETAAARAVQIPEPLKSHAVAGVATAWAEKDAKACLAWIATFSNAILAEKAQAGVIRGLAQNDPLAALNHLATLPLTVETERLVGESVGAWVKKDATAALQWADNLRDSDSRQHVFENYFYWSAMQNLDRTLEALGSRATQIKPAAKYYETLVSVALRRVGPQGVDALFAKLPEDHRAMASECIIDNLKETPANLEKWAAIQPEGRHRASALATIAWRKFAVSSAESVQWVESLPQSASRDAAVERLAEAFSDQQPAESVKLSRLMSNAEEAERIAATFYRDWQTKDPSKAAEWLRSTKLISTQRKQELSEPQ